MKAEIIYQSGENKTMMYKDLKELNDKLVLIRIQQDHRAKVSNFNQVGNQKVSSLTFSSILDFFNFWKVVQTNF